MLSRLQLLDTNFVWCLTAFGVIVSDINYHPRRKISTVFGREKLSSPYSDGVCVVYADDYFGMFDELDDLQRSDRSAETRTILKNFAKVYTRDYIAPPRQGARLWYARAIAVAAVLAAPVTFPAFVAARFFERFGWKIPLALAVVGWFIYSS